MNLPTLIRRAAHHLLPAGEGIYRRSHLARGGGDVACTSSMPMAGSRSRRLGGGVSFQEDGHGVLETLFERIGPVFPPSADPVAGDKYEHPFHHFREMQRLLIGADFAALLAFGEESFVLLVKFVTFLAQNALRIGHHPRLLCNETMKLRVFVPRGRPLADHAPNAVGYAAIVAFEFAFHRRD